MSLTDLTLFTVGSFWALLYRLRHRARDRCDCPRAPCATIPRSVVTARRRPVRERLRGNREHRALLFRLRRRQRGEVRFDETLHHRGIEIAHGHDGKISEIEIWQSRWTAGKVTILVVGQALLNAIVAIATVLSVTGRH